MEKKICILKICIALIFLASCSNKPSDEVIQTAIAATSQASDQNTEIPSPTFELTSSPVPTRTPLPTQTPQNQLGSRSNPYPLGEPAPFTREGNMEVTFAVVEVLRGDDAWNKIYAENRFNDEAPEGYEYIMIKLSVNYLTGPSPDSLFEISNGWPSDIELAIVSNNKIVTESVFIVDPKPEFDLKLFPGSSGEGYVTLLCEKDDPNPILLFPSVEKTLAFFELQ